MQQDDFNSPDEGLIYLQEQFDETEEKPLSFSTQVEGPSKALLFGLDMGLYDAERSIAELGALAEARGIATVAEVLQKRAKPWAATVLGSGRLAEARLLAQNLEANIAIFDGELTGSQIRNLEQALEIAVIDRTMLILEIFASRATTHEGKLQTELAMLEYRLPRLSGLSGGLSRQGGGGGGGGGARRGGGEQKLEYDRRYIRAHIVFLKKKLESTIERRAETRRNRQKSGVPVVALVGYTNVGKSSLANALTGSDIVAADMLFATLDPTARKLELPGGQSAVLIDTVGFVSRLPHKLVDAFKSTLEEAAFADLLIKVCDAADPEANEQLRVTDGVLAQLGGEENPQIVVYNKCDLIPGFVPFYPSSIAVSAQTGEGLPALLNAISEKLADRVGFIQALLPYDKLSLADVLRSHGAIQTEEYRDEGVYFEANLQKNKLYIFEPYLVSPKD